jgi:DNA gyrase subunit A
MTLKKNAVVSGAKPFEPGMLENAHRFRTRNLPAAGAIPKDGDLFEQISL